MAVAAIVWRWWGWGSAELKVSDAEYWQLGGPLGGNRLHLNRRRSAASDDVPMADAALQVKLGLFSSHYHIGCGEQRYRLKPVGLTGNRFELSSEEQAVVYRFQRLPHVLGCEDAGGGFVASAMPDPPGLGYTPRWQVERAPRQVQQNIPLDLVCLALLVRTDHWSHRQPMR